MYIESENKDNLMAGKRLIRILRGWHRLEQKIGEQKPDKKTVDVIDIDVAPKGIPPYGFKTREDVEYALFDIKSSFNRDYLDGEYLFSKVDASYAYLQALEAYDFGLTRPQALWEYLQRTMGIRLQTVPETELEKQRSEVADIFHDLGYSYDPSGYQKFVDEKPMDLATFKRTFPRAESVIKPVMYDILGDETFQANYILRAVEVPEGWVNWISSEGKNLILSFNTHPLNRKRQHSGVEWSLAAHEVGGHVMQAKKYQRNIDRGIINPAYGILTIPSREQWMSEGTATELYALVPGLYDLFPVDGKFTCRSRSFFQLVNNNVQMDLNSDNPPTEQELVDKVTYYLPGETRERILKRREDQTTHPKNRSYMVAYEDGTRYFDNLSQKLSDEQKTRLIRMLYTQPMTPKQIKSWVKTEFKKPKESAA